jgi:phosphonatase-like hydrolase
VYARFQEALRSAYRARARPVPGADGVFLRLKQLQVDTVLNTGLDRETAELIVRSLGWDGLGLGGLVTGDDVERGRPAPDLIQAAMRLRNVEDPASVVAVGDTTSDLDAAAAAGVGWSIGVLTGAHTRSRLEAHPHTVILESVEALPAWLEGAGALPPPSSWPGGAP